MELDGELGVVKGKVLDNGKWCGLMSMRGRWKCL